jgi:hypothetical protein
MLMMFTKGRASKLSACITIPENCTNFLSCADDVEILTATTKKSRKKNFLFIK